MKDKIKILFVEEPESFRYKKDHWTYLPTRKALEFIESGEAKAVDVEILADDFPARDLLFAAGIYSPGSAEKADLETIEGIGAKTAEKIKEALKTDPED